MSRRPSPIFELFMMRFRAMWREPSVLFWVFVFPIITTLVLGLAFRSRGPVDLRVAVAQGPGADALVQAISKADELEAVSAEPAAAKELLRKGQVALVVVPGPTPELVFDPGHPEARAARALVQDAINRDLGRRDVAQFELRPVQRPGARYVDFLIPGLLGFGLMSSAVWGLGWGIVQMRIGKLLKRLAATPMRRADFLLSFVLSRLVFALVETAFFAAFAYFLFDLAIAGSAAAFVTFALCGSLSFSGLALFIASRAQNSESASGLMNLTTMPMMVLSGVFFSASNFPEWMQPLVKALPLTALVDGLRAIMLEASPLFALWSQLLVLLAWGGGGFLVALRIFRWS